MKEKYQIYIHIPFCKARCGYCAFSSCINYQLCESYFEKLYQQIDNAVVYPNVEISTIFIGGGTPSSVEGKYIDGIFSHLRNKFDLSSVCEITVECNPESVTEKLLQCLKSNGVNRLSFGLQSVNDGTLQKIGRIHRYKQFERAVNLAVENGFDNLNADLIIGLPERVEDFENSIKRVVTLPLKHVSMYALELYENAPIYNLCKSQFDYSDDELADMYDYAIDTLEAHGFCRYEISNFAKIGHECKHNLGYWQEARYYGFGASASGFEGNVRYDNPFDVAEYIATPVENLTKNSQVVSQNDQANEYVMLGLRLTKGISLSHFEATYGKNFCQFFDNATELIEQGYIQIDGDNAFVPADKLYVVNGILSELLHFD